MKPLPRAVLVVSSPSGAESRLSLERTPFRIGRHADNDLVVRDNRVSRYHARIVSEGDDYVIEDLKSSCGVFVNEKRVERATLAPRRPHRVRGAGFVPPHVRAGTDRRSGAPGEAAAPTAGASQLAKLRATLEVARTLQSSLSTDDVLSTVVDAALTITGCERGFLLLRNAGDLEIRIARSRSGPLPKTDLRVPTRLLLRALDHRRELLSMNFDPAGDASNPAELSIYDLELRSVVCVPLVRVRAGSAEQATVMPSVQRHGRPALHGFPPAKRGPLLGRARTPDHAGPRSFHHPRKRPPARRAMGRAADGAGAAHRPADSGKPDAAIAAVEAAGSAPRRRASRRSRSAATTSISARSMKPAGPPSWPTCRAKASERPCSLRCCRACSWPRPTRGSPSKR